MKDELEEFISQDMFVTLLDGETFFLTYAGSFWVNDTSFSMFLNDRETRLIQTSHIVELKNLSQGDSRPT